ncbi:hypothetical protein J5N97_008829 [Dioscorea zingiberensis]|uniref:Uncharacterized protein n=1 Tax=Dioscorea zingiberensis TaxID=325984 RepID=A0A9D5CWW2_9LILI|nr:hypothetical protein J5N97_008829 [Dioscorea zingiberensis]
MDLKSLQEGDCLIDLESGVNTVLMEQEGCQSAPQGKKMLNRVHSGFRGIERSTRGEQAVSSGYNSSHSSFDGSGEDDDHLLTLRFEGDGKVGPLEKKVVAEERQKKVPKKPPKPPRPPKSLSLDAGDEKLVQEISRLKRARIDRIKALKRKKNSRTTSSSSNLWAMIVTVLFCLIIFWQAM